MKLGERFTNETFVSMIDEAHVASPRRLRSGKLPSGGIE